MKVMGHGILVCLLLGSATGAGHAQAPAPPVSSGATDQRAAQLEQRLETISAALAATQQQIEQSQRQMLQLQKELVQLRQQISGAGPSMSFPPVASLDAPSGASSGLATSATANGADMVAIEERQHTLEAAVKLHDQTKLESRSKYPVRFTGLILFNGFLNRGVADNTDLPAFALRASSTSSNGNLGAGLRQTILGIEGDGPRIAGARTSADGSPPLFSHLPFITSRTPPAL